MIRISRHRSVLRLAVLAALGLAAALLAGPAQAATDLGRYTYNLPSTTEAGGAEYLAYAATDAAGEVHVVQYDTSLNEKASWYYSTSSTFVGSGPSIASVNGQAVVVAWADGGTGHIYIAYVTGNGFACVTDLYGWLQDSVTGTPAGISHDTPFLASEGADGAGDLLLGWVDAATSHLHLSIIEAPTAANCGSIDGFEVASGTTVNLTSDTSWDGPALAVSGYGGSEKVWLMWAGNDSGHHLNIAAYTPTFGAYGKTFTRASKITESNHSTLTDAGGAFNSNTGQVWLTYCGTNNTAYYQEFSPSGSGGGSEFSTGSSCNIDTYKTGGITYYNGGVGASYMYSTHTTLLTWAAQRTVLIDAEVL